MRPFAILVMLALLTAVLAGCTHSNGSGDQAAVDTTHGCILFEFFRDEAPGTVDNFIQYAEDGYYEGTIFHRIIQNFMIQGGGFTPDGQQKETREPIPLEYEVPNERGNVAMARTQDPDSATSQFFINTADNTPNLGPGGVDPHGYTVFARVVEGMDVVDAIASEPTGQGPTGMRDWPQNPPVIESVRVGEDCGDQEPVEPEPTVPTEYIPFWVRNTGDEEASFQLAVEGPEGWNLSLESESVELGVEGQRGDAAASYLVVRDYEPIDGDALIRLNITSIQDETSSLVLEIQPVFSATTGTYEDFGATEGTGVEAGMVTNTQREDGVWETYVSTEPVSTPGDSVSIAYTGSFDNGTVFDSGSFPTSPRSGQTVAGFDTGLLGLEEGETVHIRFPPETAYGYEPGQGRERFAGQWLNFEITLEQLN